LPIDPPVRETDPMPAHAGIWISDGGRAWRLLAEEFAKGLGIPKSWGNLAILDPRLLGLQTCSHIYEWLGNVLASVDAYTDDNTNDEDRQQLCRRHSRHLPGARICQDINSFVVACCVCGRQSDHSCVIGFLGCSCQAAISFVVGVSWHLPGRQQLCYRMFWPLPRALKL
jgi:hypothetical protein